LVVVVHVLLLALAVRVTSAPAPMAPCGSDTWPVTLPDDAVCALADDELRLSDSPVQTTKITRWIKFFFMESSSGFELRHTVENRKASRSIGALAYPAGLIKLSQHN